MREGDDRRSFGARHEVALSLLPFLVGIVTAVPLWGADAPPVFFATAAEVIALGAVAMALEGGFFRVSGRGRRQMGGVSRAAVLVSVGVGLGFAFGALIRGNAADPHVAMTAGALAMGVSAFAVHAIFGDPGEPEASP